MINIVLFLNSLEKILDIVDKDICGIYKITNKLDNMVYYGSSIVIRKRLKQHISALKHKKHGNYKLQEAYNRDGIESFIFEIKRSCKEENLEKIEDFLIKKYKTYKRNIGYNIKEGSRSCSKEMRKLWSERRKNNPVYINNINKAHQKKHNNLKRVGLYNKNGEFLKLFKNHLELEKHLGISRKSFYYAVNKNRTSNGYMFAYIDEANPYKFITPKINGNLNKSKPFNAHKILFKGKEESRIFNNKEEVMKEFGICRDTVNNWIKGKTILKKLKELGSLTRIN